MSRKTVSRTSKQKDEKIVDPIQWQQIESDGWKHI